MIEILNSIFYYSKIIGVNSYLLLAICTQESGLKNIYIQNDKGTPTIGVCGLKGATSEFLGFKGDHKNLMNIKLNIKYAALYLKYQSKRYGQDDWCAQTSAYNSGSFLESEKMPNYPKNLKYVRLVQQRLPKELRYKLNCGKLPNNY